MLDGEWVVKMEFDVTKFEEKIRGIEITVGVAADGSYIAFSNSEPSFCIERGTEAEVFKAVSSILTSYAKCFYSAPSSFNVGIQIQELRVPQIPIRDYRPSRGVTPTFSNQSNPPILAYA